MRGLVLVHQARFLSRGLALVLPKPVQQRRGKDPQELLLGSVKPGYLSIVHSHLRQREQAQLSIKILKLYGPPPQGKDLG